MNRLFLLLFAVQVSGLNAMQKEEMQLFEDSSINLENLLKGYSNDHNAKNVKITAMIISYLKSFSLVDMEFLSAKRIIQNRIFELEKKAWQFNLDLELDHGMKKKEEQFMREAKKWMIPKNYQTIELETIALIKKQIEKDDFSWLNRLNWKEEEMTFVSRNLTKEQIKEWRLEAIDQIKKDALLRKPNK